MPSSFVASSVRRFRRVLAGTALLTAWTLVFTLVLVPEEARATEPAKDDTPVVLERGDQGAAFALARAEGKRVEVTGARTEYSTLWANPEGTLTAESATGPIRARDGQGEWAPLDQNLAALPNGHVGPKNVVDPFTTSGGSTGGAADAWRKLVWSGSGATGVSWWWQGRLPKPTLLGDTALYSEVAPGVNLRVQATSVGFEVFVDVNQRPAGPLAFPLAIKTGADVDLAEQVAGAFTVADAEGSKVAVSAPPMMWQAGVDPQDPEQEEQVLPVPTDVVAAGSTNTTISLPADETLAATGDPQVGTSLPSTDAELADVLDSAPTGAAVQVLAPDAAFLADEGTEFPVTVDPNVSLTPSFDTHVQSGVTTDQSASSYLKLGTSSTEAASRTYMSFPAATFAGKQVTSATLNVWNAGSATCTANNWEVWSADAKATTATRWTNMPGLVTLGATSSVTKGFSASCPDAWANVNITSLADAVATGASDLNLGLKAASSASDTYHSFYSHNHATSGYRPTLSVTYNTRPSTPTSPNVSPTGSIVSSVAQTNKVATRIAARVSDPDGDTVTGRFKVFQWVSSAWVQLLPNGSSNSIPGTTVKGSGTSYLDLTTGNGFTGAAALASGNLYAFKSTTQDGGAEQGYWTANYTQFRIDTPAPTAPTAGTCSYPANAWTATVANATCTFTATDTGGSGLSSYSYTIDNAKTGTITNGMVPLSGLAEGWHTLTVTAVDQAGNRSTVTTRSFGIGAGGFETPEDGVAVTSSIPLLGSTASGSSLTVQYEDPNAAGTWITIPGAQMGGANPLPLTSAGTGLLRTGAVTWDASTVATTDRTIRVRGCIDGGTTCTAVKAITIDRVGNAGASLQLGPGSVSVGTGNFSLSESDVEVAGARSGLSVSRTYDSFRASTDSVFGKGWTPSLPSGASDWASLTDNGSSVLLYGSDNAPVAFTKVGSAYVASDDAAGLTLAKAGTGTNTTFTVTSPDEQSTSDSPSTIFKPLGGVTPPATPTTSTPGRYTVATTTAPAQGTTRFTYDGSGRPLRAAAPLANAATDQLTACPVNGSNAPSGSWAAGCRDLAFTYDANNRITKVAYRYAPTTAGTATSVDVACYTYNASGQLTSSWDPRDRFGGTTAPSCADGAVLATTYGYNATSGRIETITPPGVQPFVIGYDGQGRAVTATRTHSGSSDAEVSTIKYSVDIGAASTPADDTHPDLRASTVALWGQTTVPTTAVAEFGPGDNPADLRTGTIHAYDALGREVNTAQFSGTGQAGWKISTTDYDDNGNAWRSLSAGNRDLALGSNTDPRLVELGLEGKTSAEIAAQLDQRSIYSVPDTYGVQDELESFGPRTLVARSTGAMVAARQHTVTTYGTIDYPTVTPTDWVTQGPEHSPIKTVVTALTSDGVDIDPIETRLAYALKSSGNTANEQAGWDLRTPVQTITEMGAVDVVRQTALDAITGKVTEERQPSSAGMSANQGTRRTVYYAAGAHNPAGCVSDAWFGQVCRIEPGAQPASGNKLLVTSTTAYDQYLRPTQVTESTSGSVCTTASTTCRVSTTTFDANGWGARTTGSQMTGGLGTALPTTTITYDTATGRVLTTSDGARTITSGGIDDFGRATTFTDADGGQTATAFDSTSGRRISTTVKRPDGSTLGSTTYAYGTATDFRGLPSSVTHSELSGAITAVYGADGNLIEQQVPATGGNLKQVWEFDTTGNDTSTTITKNGTVFLSHQQSSDAQGRVQAEDGDLLAWGREYDYDNAGRVTQTRERRVGGASTAVGDEYACLTRTYGFAGNAGLNGNRTSQATYGANTATGECTTTGTALSTASFTIDAADRMSASGMTLDAFGRTTDLPAAYATSGSAVTLGYYASDFVASIATGTQSRSYGLDPAGNVRTVTATGVPAGTPTSTLHHYDGGGDSPTWTLDTSSTGTITTRFLDGLSGDPVATSTTGASAAIALNLINLHGDVVRTTSPTATGAPDGQFNDADEFGITRDPADPTGAATANGPRYGWLGAKQRAADTGAGLMLMGVRVYAPILGRFLQIDPVFGGNESTYGYPNNPIKVFDLDGRWGSWLKKVATFNNRIAPIKKWVHKNRFRIADVAVGVAAGVLAAATVAAVCAGTAGAGCFIIGAAMARVAYGTVGRAVAYKALGGRYRGTHVLRMAARDAAMGGLGGFVRYKRNMMK